MTSKDSLAVSINLNRLARNAGEAIAPSLADFGGYLRCESCGTHRPLGDVGDKLNNGWPRCCGYTMRWWTQRQINAGEVPLTGGDPTTAATGT